MKTTDLIKIENRGKVEEDLLIITENFIQRFYYDLNFKKFYPKMFYILKKKELKDNEEFGFIFSVLFDIFKGKISICKIKNSNCFNIYFYKRHPIKGRFDYNLYKTKENIQEDNIKDEFDFLIKGENQKIQTGKAYLLKNGMIGIVKKYYSNTKIGIIYDEYSEKIEDFITIEDIEKILK